MWRLFFTITLSPSRNTLPGNQQMGFELAWDFSVHGFNHLAISGVARKPKLPGHNFKGV